MKHISLKYIFRNTSFKAKCSQQVIKNPYKRTKLQMFVPQAGKTAFNHSTLILIIRVSFAVWCPRFETEETQNKHAAPGKENTDEFTPALSFCRVCPAFSPAETHPLPLHMQIRYGNSAYDLHEMEQMHKNLIYTCTFCTHVNNMCTISRSAM